MTPTFSVHEFVSDNWKKAWQVCLQNICRSAMGDLILTVGIEFTPPIDAAA